MHLSQKKKKETCIIFNMWCNFKDKFGPWHSKTTVDKRKQKWKTVVVGRSRQLKMGNCIDTSILLSSLIFVTTISLRLVVTSFPQFIILPIDLLFFHFRLQLLLLQRPWHHSMYKLRPTSFFNCFLRYTQNMKHFAEYLCLFPYKYFTSI